MLPALREESAGVRMNRILDILGDDLPVWVMVGCAYAFVIYTLVTAPVA